MQQCLPSVMETEYKDFRVVVVDNASTDGSVTWLKQHYPKVSIIENGENYGFARGNNIAIEQSQAEYVVLLNNDVEVTPTWLSALVSRADRFATLGAVAPKLLHFERRNEFEYAGAAGGLLDNFGYPFARGRIFHTLEVDEGQYDDQHECFWATGAALLLRRSALMDVGLLDESFFMHMEEIDLCWRLRRSGYTVHCETSVAVYHIGGASLARDNPRKAYYNFRNSLLMLYKNGGRLQWPRRFAVRCILDSLAAVRFLLLGSPRSAAAILRAYAHAHRMKTIYDGQRTAEDEAPPPLNGSIILQYFVRRRRTASALSRYINSVRD